MNALTQVADKLQRADARGRRLINDTYAAIALAAATVVALIWANVGSTYERFWSTEFGFSLGEKSFHLTLHEWVDEGLMALFFLMVGLDVRHEITLGELRQKERAVLPAAAALGGLILPALIFLGLTHGQDYSHAWGAVISTDTAFALGMLALIGPARAPRLKIFLLALAVIDDIGALLVIAFVYTNELTLAPLAVAAVALLGVYLLQRRGEWRTAPYAVLGVITWLAVFQSGIHATLAGVLVALLLPVHATRGRDVALSSVAFRLFRQAPSPGVAMGVRRTVTRAIPMNPRLSQALPPYVNYLVVPLFALANAGVPLSGESIKAAFSSQLTWGIIAGLVVGKFVGILGASVLVRKFLPASRLPGVDGPRIGGVAALCGMGFTISLLVVSLAIEDTKQQDQARIGVITASLIALVLGVIVFKLGGRFKPLPPPSGAHLERDVDPAHDHIRGPQDAPVNVVVYGAMSPRFRHSTSSALRDVERLYPEQVNLVFRHRVSTDAERGAAYCLEAAAAQGKFWDLYEEFTTSREPMDRDGAMVMAERAGLDIDRLEERIQDERDSSHIGDDTCDLSGMDLDDGEPVVYVNAERVTGELNAWSLTKAVEKHL